MGLADAIVDLVHALADLLQHRVVGVVGVVGVGRAAAWAGCLPSNRRRKRVGEVLPVIRMTGMPRRGGCCQRRSGTWPGWGEGICCIAECRYGARVCVTIYIRES